MKVTCDVCKQEHYPIMMRYLPNGNICQSCSDELAAKKAKPLESDGWGACATCGQPTGSADLWQDTCPRCAELAALEREIGRAVIGHGILAHTISKLIDIDDHAATSFLYPFYDDAWEHWRRLNMRYRGLHAADADAATGGEAV